MDKIIDFVEKRIIITGAAYERSHSVQWLRRKQEAKLILMELKNMERRERRAAINRGRRLTAAE